MAETKKPASESAVEATPDPRRGKDSTKIAGGRYVVDPKTGATARTEGIGTDEHAAAQRAAAKKGKE
jgi:hypothetical protein